MAVGDWPCARESRAPTDAFTVRYSTRVPLFLLALLLLLPVALALMMPFILLQRYRIGTMRRLARPWVATLNVVAMVLSVVFFLLTAVIANLWISGVLTSSLIGLAAGSALGIVGVLLTRWEVSVRALHYTPNRWLVLIVTLAVALRVLYGFWRGWMTLRAAPDESLVTAFGVVGSLGVAAMVIGYYFAYGVGLRWRIARWEKRRVRLMN
jgi:hypothetical protein